MRTLYVLYDQECGLCAAVKDWLAVQPAYVPVRVVAAGSREAQRWFPGLPAGELAAVSDAGEAWLGDRAWIVCLWALRRYRGLATRLSSPVLLPLARNAFAAVSRNRTALGALMGLRRESELAEALGASAAPRCVGP